MSATNKLPLMATGGTPAPAHGHALYYMVMIGGVLVLIYCGLQILKITFALWDQAEAIREKRRAEHRRTNQKGHRK